MSLVCIGGVSLSVWGSVSCAHRGVSLVCTGGVSIVLTGSFSCVHTLEYTDVSLVLWELSLVRTGEVSLVCTGGVSLVCTGGVSIVCTGGVSLVHKFDSRYILWYNVLHIVHLLVIKKKSSQYRHFPCVAQMYATSLAVP